MGCYRYTNQRDSYRFALPMHIELHAQYSNVDIKAALGQTTLESAGQTGVGVLHFRDLKVYAISEIQYTIDPEGLPGKVFENISLEKYFY